MNQFFTIKTDIDANQRARLEAGESPAKVLQGQPWFLWLPLPQGGHSAHPIQALLTASAVNAILELPEDEPGEWFINIDEGLSPAIAFTASGEDEPNPNECIQLDKNRWLILSCIPVS